MSAIATPAMSSPGQMSEAQLDQLSINCIRTLSIDAVQQAESGHPGTPMALAPLVYTLWNRVMRFDPQDPIWPNRDRFLLSNGHASMLLWSVLHLTGTRAVNADYERLEQPAVSLDDIRHFRQLGSKAPGHPEYHLVSGVEATTGPLGQGVAISVGMAIAEAWLANRYNRPGFEIFDYNIYAICGDGCMMEGVSSEAASLAGHLALDNLCWIYDNNHITIPSSFSIAISVTARRTSRTPPPRTANRWARRRCVSPSAITDGRRTPSSSCPTPCAPISPPASAPTARRRTPVGTNCLLPIARNIPNLRPRST
jgi:transketolase